MSFLTCLVRSHKSKTLLPSLPSLLPFPFLLLSRSVDPPAPPRRLRLPRVLRAFPRLALSSSPCVGLPHLAYAPVHALNSYLLVHASSWLFLCAPVLPFELMGPLYSYAEFRVACSSDSQGVFVACIVPFSLCLSCGATLAIFHIGDVCFVYSKPS